MTATSRQLKLALFMNTTEYAWMYEKALSESEFEFSLYKNLAQMAERAKFDAVFLADVVCAYDKFRGGPETALREGMQIPANDPLMVIPAMAAVTKDLGFGVTFSTTYEPPYGAYQTPP